jgi:hypothetical protein
MAGLIPTELGGLLRGGQSATKHPAQRARQEIDDGWQDQGYGFGALQPATGATWMEIYQGRTIANGVDVLDRVEAWIRSTD